MDSYSESKLVAKYKAGFGTGPYFKSYEGSPKLRFVDPLPQMTSMFRSQPIKQATLSNPWGKRGK
jgi:hypothetical protein